jgi:RimJ/RimL family protein N-acetyltransferase
MSMSARRAVSGTSLRLAAERRSLTAGLRSDTADVLTTARLWIRPFTLADVPDATTAVGLLMDSDERNREWITRLGVAHQREHGYAYWQCRDKGTGQLVGFCGWREHDLGASLGYAFAGPTRGNGYAKEAASAVVEWGLTNIGAERLYASVRPPNPASCKVLEHVGTTLVREYVDAHGPRLIHALPGRPPLPQTR